MEIMRQDGGYVFAPGHNIQALVPPENVKAMLDAALECSKYQEQLPFSKAGLYGVFKFVINMSIIYDKYIYQDGRRNYYEINIT